MIVKIKKIRPNITAPTDLKLFLRDLSNGALTNEEIDKYFISRYFVDSNEELKTNVVNSSKRYLGSLFKVSNAIQYLGEAVTKRLGSVGNSLIGLGTMIATNEDGRTSLAEFVTGLGGAKSIVDYRMVENTIFKGQTIYDSFASGIQIIEDSTVNGSIQLNLKVNYTSYQNAQIAAVNYMKDILFIRSLVDPYDEVGLPEFKPVEVNFNLTNETSDIEVDFHNTNMKKITNSLSDMIGGKQVFLFNYMNLLDDADPFKQKIKSKLYKSAMMLKDEYSNKDLIDMYMTVLDSEIDKVNNNKEYNPNAVQLATEKILEIINNFKLQGNDFHTNFSKKYIPNELLQKYNLSYYTDDTGEVVFFSLSSKNKNDEVDNAFQKITGLGKYWKELKKYELNVTEYRNVLPFIDVNAQQSTQDVNEVKLLYTKMQEIVKKYNFTSIHTLLQKQKTVMLTDEERNIIFKYEQALPYLSQALESEYIYGVNDWYIVKGNERNTTFSKDFSSIATNVPYSFYYGEMTNNIPNDANLTYKDSTDLNINLIEEFVDGKRNEQVLNYFSTPNFDYLFGDGVDIETRKELLLDRFREVGSYPVILAKFNDSDLLNVDEDEYGNDEELKEQHIQINRKILQESLYMPWKLIGANAFNTKSENVEVIKNKNSVLNVVDALGKEVIKTIDQTVSNFVLNSPSPVDLEFYPVFRAYDDRHVKSKPITYKMFVATSVSTVSSKESFIVREGNSFNNMLIPNIVEYNISFVPAMKNTFETHVFEEFNISKNTIPNINVNLAETQTQLSSIADALKGTILDAKTSSNENTASIPQVIPQTKHLYNVNGEIDKKCNENLGESLEKSDTILKNIFVPEYTPKLEYTALRQIPTPNNFGSSVKSKHFTGRAFDLRFNNANTPITAFIDENDDYIVSRDDGNRNFWNLYLQVDDDKLLNDDFSKKYTTNKVENVFFKSDFEKYNKGEKGTTVKNENKSYVNLTKIFTESGLNRIGTASPPKNSEHFENVAEFWHFEVKGNKDNFYADVVDMYGKDRVLEACNTNFMYVGTNKVEVLQKKYWDVNEISKC